MKDYDRRDGDGRNESSARRAPGRATSGMPDVCIDEGRLTDVAAAAGVDPGRTLGHVVACERCRGTLEVVATLRAPLHAVEVSPEAQADAERFVAGFDAVAAMGREPHSASPPPAMSAVIRAASVLVAAATGVGASLLVSARVVDVSPLGALAAGLLAVGVMAFGERERATVA